VLTLITAIEELAVSLEETAVSRGALRTGDRTSFAADLDVALTRAGAPLQSATSPTLKALRTGAVFSLGQIFGDPTECARIGKLCRTVLDQLGKEGVVDAARDDVIETFAAGASTADRCALVVERLNELGRACHDLWSAYVTASELVREDKLDESRAYVGQPPADDALVAWVAFGNASIDPAVLRVGQVRFFDGRTSLKALRDQLKRIEDPLYAPIDELSDHVLDTYFRDVEAEHVVYARVELAGDRAREPTEARRRPPVAWVRSYASDLVEAAGFRYGGTQWVFANGIPEHGQASSALAGGLHTGPNDGDSALAAPNRPQLRAFYHTSEEPHPDQGVWLF
jgi:hypothetical protein